MVTRAELLIRCIAAPNDTRGEFFGYISLTISWVAVYEPGTQYTSLRIVASSDEF